MAAHILPGLGLTGGFLDGQDNWGDGMNANVALLTIAVQTSVLSAVAAVPGAPGDGDAYLLTGGPNVNRIASWDEAEEAWTYTQPQEGWRLFNQDTGTYLAFIGGSWDEDAAGSGVPAGGTTGQVLAKQSDDDGDADWVDPETAALPPGGDVGQVLTKTDGGAEWDDVSSLPPGGTTGQVLVKASPTAGDVEWADPASATDIVWALVRTIDGAILKGQGCTVEKVTISQFFVTFDTPRPDADYGIIFGGTSTPVGVQPYIVYGSKTVEGFGVICLDVNGGQADAVELVFQLAGTGVTGDGAGGVEELPAGGTTGQVLAKASNADNDVAWIDPPEGGGGGGGGGAAYEWLCNAPRMADFPVLETNLLVYEEIETAAGMSFNMMSRGGGGLSRTIARFQEYEMTDGVPFNIVGRVNMAGVNIDETGMGIVMRNSGTGRLLYNYLYMNGNQNTDFQKWGNLGTSGSQLGGIGTWNSRNFPAWLSIGIDADGYYYGWYSNDGASFYKMYGGPGGESIFNNAHMTGGVDQLGFCLFGSTANDRYSTGSLNFWRVEEGTHKPSPCY